VHEMARCSSKKLGGLPDFSPISLEQTARGKTKKRTARPAEKAKVKQSFLPN